MTATLAKETKRARGRGSPAVASALPLAALALLAGALVWADPAGFFDNGAPPVEDLAFERVVLREGAFEFHVRNVGQAPVVIAQVLVDDAYWVHDVRPEATVERLRTAVIHVSYPWVEGDAHEVVVVTETGATFDHEVEVAVASPEPGAFLARGVVIGLLVGVLPIAAGIAWFPALRDGSPRVRTFVLALTVGLLTFLGIDALAEGLEAADEAAAALGGAPLVLTAAAVAVLLVLFVDRWARDRAPGGSAPALTLGYLIALAIGFHNFGEGLAIGGAYAGGEAALGAALFIGFALHNVTEGPAIVAPLARAPPARFLAHAFGLVALAGLPTIGGAWLGALAATPVWVAVALGLGAGAALVVVVQVWPHLRAESGGTLSATVLAGLAAGVLVMYFTGLLA